ncbi:hypothetical protein HA402_005036 [Bradysia odoriphaga]|nr:hypothetical protein HA402_005036 [Bradysia odoriphaga]
MWEQSGQTLPGVNLDKLSVDQAFLNISSHLSHRLWMYSLSEDCVRCPFTRSRDIAPHSHAMLKFDAARQVAWKFFDKDLGPYAFNNVTSFCTINPSDIGMFGVYNIDITDENCNYEVALQPVNVYLSLLFALLILAFALLIIYGSNRYYTTLSEIHTDNASGNKSRIGRGKTENDKAETS